MDVFLDKGREASRRTRFLPEAFVFFTAPVISRTEKGARCGNAFHVANGRVTMLLVLALLFAMVTNASALVIVGNFTGGSAPGNTAASGTVVDIFNAHCKHRP
jgi:hypothetical protein